MQTLFIALFLYFYPSVRYRLLCFVAIREFYLHDLYYLDIHKIGHFFCSKLSEGYFREINYIDVNFKSLCVYAYTT